MNHLEETEILYEISLSLGTSLNLNSMLREAVSTMMRTLNCSGAEILQAVKKEAHSGGEEGGIEWLPVCTLPRTLKRNKAYTSFLDLTALPAFLNERDDWEKTLPLTQEKSGKHYMLFNLPDFGVLALELPGESLSYNLRRSFQVLMNKLANAAKACLYEEELQRQVKASQAANIAKSQFLANMSHELRTPLNGVIGFTEMLNRTELTSIQKEYVESAKLSGQNLLRIINDILDLSKIEAGMLSLEMIKTDVVELLENSVDMVKYQAGRKNLELLLHIDPALPRFAVTDPIRLKQILANLLGNAVKFTKQGEVELKVAYKPEGKAKGKLTFQVRDTGIGITEEQIKKLFKAFSQADTSTTRKFGGTGLGLIISQLIAKELGTSIEVESKPGEGSTFSFEITTEVEEGDPLERGGLEPMKRCLIIDDNATSRRTLEQMLAGWNIESESCDNGLAALKILETSRPFDVILCDYYMPYIDGLETIQMIRQQLKLTPEKQPVVLLHSSSDEAELHKKCDELGVRLRLTKPLKSQDLYLSLCNVNGTTQEFEEAAVSSERAAKSVSSNKVKILIAEDITLNMTLIKALILGMYPQAELHEAVNGVEAVRLRSEIKPDLIFMDVQMPELDGLEATRQIRDIEKETGDHVPIIALTAGAFKEEREKCMAAGMDDFLTKPVEIEKISSVIKKYTEV